MPECNGAEGKSKCSELSEPCIIENHQAFTLQHNPLISVLSDDALAKEGATDPLLPNWCTSLDISLIPTLPHGKLNVFGYRAI